MLPITELSHLSQYANFTTFRFRDRTIVLYDDHRCILTVLFEARRLGIIDSETNLIFFDRHDDARKIMPDAMDKVRALISTGLEDVTQRDFNNFVEFDIREEDDDWVNVAMELGLINNVVNIGNDENDNIDSLKNNTYTTVEGIGHQAYCIPHLMDAMAFQGILTDRCRKEPKFRTVQEIFGLGDNYDYQPRNFVLDFDLDCFTTLCQGQRYGWPKSIFVREYIENYDANRILSILVNKSKFITICREPDFCGGIGESNRILSYLDRYFFEGCIGTKGIL